MGRGDGDGGDSKAAATRSGGGGGGDGRRRWSSWSWQRRLVPPASPRRVRKTTRTRPGYSQSNPSGSARTCGTPGCFVCQCRRRTHWTSAVATPARSNVGSVGRFLPRYTVEGYPAAARPPRSPQGSAPGRSWSCSFAKTSPSPSVSPTRPLEYPLTKVRFQTVSRGPEMEGSPHNGSPHFAHALSCVCIEMYVNEHSPAFASHAPCLPAGSEALRGTPQRSPRLAEPRNPQGDKVHARRTLGSAEPRNPQGDKVHARRALGSGK